MKTPMIPTAREEDDGGKELDAVGDRGDQTFRVGAQEQCVTFDPLQVSRDIGRIFHEDRLGEQSKQGDECTLLWILEVDLVENAEVVTPSVSKRSKGLVVRRVGQEKRS